MKITKIENAITFKSGYPTFGGCGHLSINPIYDDPFVFPGSLFRDPIPGGIRPQGGILHKVNYIA